jgi:hypothetical protein
MEKEAMEYGMNVNRRKFLSRLSLGIGSAALGSLLIPDLFGGAETEATASRITALCSKGQEGDLPVSEWRAIAA